MGWILAWEECVQSWDVFFAFKGRLFNKFNVTLRPLNPTTI